MTDERWNRWRHLEFDWEWGSGFGVKPVAPPTPTLTEEDRRPVAGRLLGPRGETLSVVRHGPEPVAFGFQAQLAREDQ